MLLLGTFAVIALLLAALGTYSLLAYSVRRRTGEIGIRVAVGAARGDILRLILWDGMKLIAIGVLVGLFGALSLSRFLRSMVFGVRPTDPLTFVAVAVLLALVALVACYLPARRALRIDPMIALREE
jgi:putative ABC transport system permease protein